MDAIRGKNVESVVMLSLSKHWRAKASPRVLRQAQDDTQPAQKQSVIARYEAISELYRFAHAMPEHGCHAEPVEAWWAKASARVLRQAQDDTPPTQKQSVIVRYEAISELYRSERMVTDSILTCLRRYCFVPRNIGAVKFAIGFLFSLFISVNVWAQTEDTTHKDSSNRFIIRDAPSITKSDKACFIVNGKYYDKDIRTIDPKTITYVEVLKGISATALYGSRAANGVVIILTKTYANNQIQSKLGKFSENYRNYLIQHQNKDNDIEYVLNGLPLDDYIDRIKKLYKIAPSKIKKVELLPNPSHNGYIDKKKIVNIITAD